MIDRTKRRADTEMEVATIKALREIAEQLKRMNDQRMDDRKLHVGWDDLTGTWKEIKQKAFGGPDGRDDCRAGLRVPYWCEIHHQRIPCDGQPVKGGSG